MTRIVVKNLVFDRFNLSHIAKHKVEKSEVIEAGKDLVYHKRTYRGRYLAIGRAGTRLIAMVLKRETAGTYYLVTARDAAKKERSKVYEKEKK